MIEKAAGAKFSDFPAKDTVEMYGESWILISFAEFKESGHYMAWMKTAKEWLRIDDDHVDIRVDTRAMNLKNYEARTLVFKKFPKVAPVERVKTPEPPTAKKPSILTSIQTTLNKELSIATKNNNSPLPSDDLVEDDHVED
ncbi:hypothetical protein GCK72_022711 [Caenorhabditis remanei]|uniref:SPK domain-containing protein n=1 Tax=Caenorhabditis remanei TaxID=31234 RepID=A0A6A5FUG1_CAERE|nr:hypothetical protein GCK72_022711 [Caenorhabditis remanei]KAF1746258.1 hypothetical protein GCK72_022711 [Caenorhabditis remanei]